MFCDAARDGMLMSVIVEPVGDHVVDANDDWMLIYKPVKLVLKIIHWDKAGKTWSHRVVKAEVADVDADRIALLVTKNGTPVTLPVSKLFAAKPTADPAMAKSYIAGHELLREFHPHDDEPRTVRRWLDRAEIEELLTRG